MAYGFDAIAIGIDQERGVVGIVIVGPQPRRAVVTPTGGQSRGVKCIDGPAARRTKAPVPVVDGNWGPVARMEI
jgi:hypothetical protein